MNSEGCRKESKVKGVMGWLKMKDGNKVRIGRV